jgi:hypothetical protein
MDKAFTQACIAMIMGTGIGMLLSVGGQKMLNQHALKTCPSKSGHQLVMLTSFIGDAFYCVDKRYL